MAGRKAAKVAVPKFQPPIQPVTVTKANPTALKLATKMADGDTSRLRINGDGSVTVLNN